ncbi:MAG: nucleotidyl transferase AbiEii/AbiGii toxin family protein [Patescibacteria group bacterium]|nr:nucleotidyl transferase AbiEii/AbiGii toxin family protein [Patescibacteria group bacterium]
MKDIYTDITISSLIGFKGGTCAYFFYGLPRFSVDLDFDLLAIDEESQKIIFKKITSILSKYGQIKDKCIKKFTIFVLLSYGEDDHNIKLEINTRKLITNLQNFYEIKKYLGISILVAKKDYLFASKLAALTSRNETTARDIYDIHYFAKNSWDINAEIIMARTNKIVPTYLADCILLIEKMKDNKILQGLGELISSAKEKAWIKTRLKTDVIFMLKNYISVLKQKD